MTKSIAFSIAVAFIVVISNANSRAQQNPLDENERGWMTITPGKTLFGIRYDDNGAVVVNNNLVMGCVPDPQSAYGIKLEVSPPSPVKKLALVMCSRDNEDEAYVIDTGNKRIVSRDVVPKHWQIINWVSWSPDERFALIAAAGEITMGDMAFINLSSGVSQEIHFKNFTNSRGIDPTKTPYDRLQDFDPDKIRWTAPTRFHLNMDVRCNPYERGEGCYDKIISTHPVDVNLSPFRIAYEATAASLRAPLAERKPSARLPSQMSGANDCKFCGVWKAVEGGRLMGRRPDDYAGKTGNPYCGCQYLRITRIAPDRFKLNIGSEYEGKVNWADDSDTIIQNADAIYLKPTIGKLTARFVSMNFYATHGMKFTYQITFELNGDDLLFSVLMVGGQTEKATYVRISV